MDSIIKGVGCDIVSNFWIGRLQTNIIFLNKVYTDYEQNYCKGRSADVAAGIWAAKEAVSKTLGTGFCGFTAKDIEIRHDKSGSPEIILYNGAKVRAELLGIRNIHISISHEKEHALAFAVAE